MKNFLENIVTNLCIYQMKTLSLSYSILIYFFIDQFINSNNNTKPLKFK